VIFIIALVDFLTFSVQNISNLDAFKDQLFGRVDWQQGRGAYGYSDCVFSGGMRLFSGKPDARFEVCVSMSGTGCRTFETLRGEGFQWSEFLQQLQNDYDVHFSRLDVALDVTEKYMPSMKSICGYVAQRKYISKFRRNIYTLGSEEFVFFGSPSSDVRLRIYNKALERGYEDQHWIRFEYQLRNDAARKFIDEYQRNKNIGYCVRSCLNNYVRFLTKPHNGDRNGGRIPTVQWWDRLLAGADKMSLFEAPGIEYNLSRLEKYLVTQVAPSLATYLRCKGGDLGVLYKLLDVGAAKMNQNQSMLVKQYQEGVI